MPPHRGKEVDLFQRDKAVQPDLSEEFSMLNTGLGFGSLTHVSWPCEVLL